MNDFTLIIPTYNRPVELERLLAYLGMAGAGFPVEILDSSDAAAAARNRQAAAAAPLPVRYRAFDPQTQPFDKFAAGAAEVATPFAAMCPDDDIPILAGLQASLQQLRDRPDHVLSHGWYFLFGGTGGDFDIHTLLYHAPGYAEPDPLRRLHRLVRRYQALTYGVYRTPVLQEALDRSRHLDSLLWREHLSSALPVIRGKAGRVDTFFMGRRAGGHSARKRWHPVEWLIDDPQGLVTGFAAFAAELAAAIAEQEAAAGGGRPAAEILPLVHLIYADYLVQHMPQEIFDTIVERRLQGVPAEEVFASREVVLPVINAGQKFLEEVRAFLYDDAYTYAHQWKSRDMIIWDNRVLQHARLPFDSGAARTLRRTAIL